MVVDQQKLAKLQAATRAGGKGAPRRKVVKKPKGAVAGGEDPKLQAGLKKLAVQPLSGIEEVNMFKEDGNVLHIASPKVHGALASNTLAVYGKAQNKELTELVPGILSQLGPESLASLRKLAESYQAMNSQHNAAQDAEGEDVPAVSGNFDEVEQANTEIDQLD
ncbi:Nascent polypeptide-associated complex subunit beta [Malassezia vespertilionis]|uniref:Nascent polypeptide-associated complex subunit beta n=1 Tax=Malassezia vespertilionis TaxID=2020962 RepID=A0A2N1JER2_9BASI|nr:Nascent polypeptide-associated complex subunit beta [Malassezia vespertilionis]PKI85015.1 Egd1p [Malassezia vespertilionis]WFD05980.1 Nascent polypeptide-associated complex subunit beta [Malassezia vespertilionis]